MMSADHACRRGEAGPPETTVCVESKSGVQGSPRPPAALAAAAEQMWAGQGRAPNPALPYALPGWAQLGTAGRRART